jgi:hypothetical protein
MSTPVDGKGPWGQRRMKGGFPELPASRQGLQLADYVPTAGTRVPLFKAGPQLD